MVESWQTFLPSAGAKVDLKQPAGKGQQVGSGNRGLEKMNGASASFKVLGEYDWVEDGLVDGERRECEEC